MSIATALANKKTQIATAYEHLEAKGAIIPTTKDVANMPDAIDSININQGNLELVESMTQIEDWSNDSSGGLAPNVLAILKEIYGDYDGNIFVMITNNNIATSYALRLVIGTLVNPSTTIFFHRGVALQVCSAKAYSVTTSTHISSGSIWYFYKNNQI